MKKSPSYQMVSVLPLIRLLLFLVQFSGGGGVLLHFPRSCNLTLWKSQISIGPRAVTTHSGSSVKCLMSFHSLAKNYISLWWQTSIRIHRACPTRPCQSAEGDHCKSWHQDDWTLHAARERKEEFSRDDQANQDLIERSCWPWSPQGKVSYRESQSPCESFELSLMRPLQLHAPCWH